MPKLGFLSIFANGAHYLGGYLVTNHWGRPLEFRLSAPVEPTRIQQVLYGPTLKPFLFGELIGKALVDKSVVQAEWILTDSEHAMELRRHIAMPVSWLETDPRPAADVECTTKAYTLAYGHGRLHGHPQFPDDLAHVRQFLRLVDPETDLAEPFDRIREAVAEARKMGAVQRAA